MPQPGYIAQLTKTGHWPVKNPKGWNKETPTTTPFLIVPMFPGDLGDRPLKPYLGFNSASVEVLDQNNVPVLVPTPGGEQYTLRSRVANLGSAGCFAGIAEFRVALPDDLDAWVGTPTHPVLGYTGFSVTPGGSVNITCPTRWTPLTPVEATKSVLVQAYDFLLDPLLHRFDAGNDRHIARRDFGAMIVNKQSGKCLSVTSMSLADNIFIQQETLNGGPNQRWIRRRLPQVAPGTVYTLTAQHSNKCLDVYAGSTADHAQVQQYQGHGGPDQQWIFQPAGGGYFFITSVNSRKCLNVSGGSLADGAFVEQLTNGNLDSQKWILQWWT